MKPTILLLALALALVTTLAGAQTNTPSEQFQSAVAAFQQSATEDNARKLAEVLKPLDPPPAIPDEAKLHALKGAAFVKQTKVETDPAAYVALFAKAATEYQAASAAAPWVGDYYFNRASCEKSAGQFAAATAALKLDLIFARTEQDRDANLALRAEIETTQEIAATRKQTAEKAKSELAAKEAAAAAERANNVLIVPGKSIGQISLGMQMSEVEKILGEPTKVYAKTINSPGQYSYVGVVTAVHDDQMKVIKIKTWQPKYRTKSGLAVGASIGAAQKEFGETEVTGLGNGIAICFPQGIGIFVEEGAGHPIACITVEAPGGQGACW